MSKRFWMPVLALWVREMLRFWRDRSRLAGYVGSPLVFWIVIGSGFGNLSFYFTGALTLTVMFAAVFSTMSLIEDRREGFLLSMMVSPAPRASMVLGKVLGATTQAWLQGLAFLLFAPLAGFSVGLAEASAAAGVTLLIAFTFTALGFWIAWQTDSAQGFHAIMNLLLMPLWMVSGALFPIEKAHPWMQWVMRANPMTYSLNGLRAALEPQAAAWPGFAASAGITFLCGVILLLLSARAASRQSARSFA